MHVCKCNGRWVFYLHEHVLNRAWVPTYKPKHHETNFFEKLQIGIQVWIIRKGLSQGMMECDLGFIVLLGSQLTSKAREPFTEWTVSALTTN